MADHKSSISNAASYEAIGEFWDEHDFADFDELTRPDEAFEMRSTVRIEAQLLAKIEKVAVSRGISTETLVNLWLLEKVQADSTAS